jgi:AAA+ superfamily predicted ATPase
MFAGLNVHGQLTIALPKRQLNKTFRMIEKEKRASGLEICLTWISEIISARLKSPSLPAIPQLSEFDRPSISGSTIEEFVNQYSVNNTELAVFLLTLASHIEPGYFNRIITDHFPEGGDFPEFGGIKGANHRGILPTGETVLYILAGNNLEKRIEIQRLFSNEHWFAKKHILWLEPVREGEPIMSGRLMVDPDTVEFLTTGKVSKPKFSNDFPAEHIETEMDWEDLVLHDSTRKQLSEIENWIHHNEVLMRDPTLRKRIKPGFRVLFYGPPGTGKTLAATLLGKQTGKDVFRIDLSRVISKYIGETEKNLSGLFDRAEDKNWILFFDEADALFGKRTDIRDAHDKYANQEVAYLLQRIESFNGVVILATNQRGNIDDAFVRRFQSIIHFPMPGIQERASIWEKALPGNLKKSKEIDWENIASRFELSGAGIVNVMHFCALECAVDKTNTLAGSRLEAAIMREYIKEGRIV